MPRGDQTGPMGFSPMTGRRAGYCADFSQPGYTNPAKGAGWGGGYGRGNRACRRRTWNPIPPAMPTPVSETDYQQLKNQITMLQTELELLKNHLAESERADSGDSQ